MKTKHIIGLAVLAGLIKFVATATGSNEAVASTSNASIWTEGQIMKDSRIDCSDIWFQSDLGGEVTKGHTPYAIITHNGKSEVYSGNDRETGGGDKLEFLFKGKMKPDLYKGTHMLEVSHGSLMVAINVDTSAANVNLHDSKYRNSVFSDSCSIRATVKGE